MNSFPLNLKTVAADLYNIKNNTWIIQYKKLLAIIQEGTKITIIIFPLLKK